MSGGAGQFSNGFSIGIIATVLSLAQAPLGLTGWWMGALGASSIVGVIVGSLIGGSITDRLGRRPLFNWGMLLFTTFAALQYLSSSAYELFTIRFLLGVSLGADYIVTKAMVAEFSPSRNRGVNLSFLSVSWSSGYFCSFIAGYAVRTGGPNAWRIALLASAAPSFIAFLLRVWMPESPQWLTRNGQLDKAREIIAKHIGLGIALPVVDRLGAGEPERAITLFKPPLLQNLLVGGVFYTSQLIPFYALGTILPIVMVRVGARDGFAGALIYNILFIIGALIGLFIIDRIPRRTLLVQSFGFLAILLAILIGWRSAPALIAVLLLAAFAFVQSIAGILQFVYPPELFPTEVRARGIGAIGATSRVGTAGCTFLFPTMVEHYGIYTALGACMVLMIFAAAVCYKWAPETLGKQLV